MSGSSGSSARAARQRVLALRHLPRWASASASAYRSPASILTPRRIGVVAAVNIRRPCDGQMLPVDVRFPSERHRWWARPAGTRTGRMSVRYRSDILTETPSTAARISDGLALAGGTGA